GRQAGADRVLVRAQEVGTDPAAAVAAPVAGRRAASRAGETPRHGGAGDRLVPGRRGRGMIQLAKVEKAIEARLSADATLTALGPVFLSFVPEGRARPYVCVTVALDNLDMLFGHRNNVANLLITVEVYADRDGGVTTPQTMMDRVYGDESSYGLHRWTPTL